MYFNRLIICGKVIKAPSVLTSKNGRNFVGTRVMVRRGVKKNGAHDYFNLNAFGEVGNSMLEKVKVDDFICVSGMVSASAFISSDGKAMPNMSVIVSKWEMDPTGTYMREAEAAYANGGEDVEAEEVNEEILF